MLPLDRPQAWSSVQGPALGDPPGARADLETGSVSIFFLMNAFVCGSLNEATIYQAPMSGRGAFETGTCSRACATGRAYCSRAGARQAQELPHPEVMIPSGGRGLTIAPIPGAIGSATSSWGSRVSAIGTLVERTNRFTLLLPTCPRMQGHGETATDQERPPLTGHGAEAVRDAIAATIDERFLLSCAAPDLGQGS